jgi:hypothetical protein
MASCDNSCQDGHCFIVRNKPDGKNLENANEFRAFTGDFLFTSPVCPLPDKLSAETFGDMPGSVTERTQ